MGCITSQNLMFFSDDVTIEIIKYFNFLENDKFNLSIFKNKMNIKNKKHWYLFKNLSNKIYNLIKNSPYNIILLNSNEKTYLIHYIAYFCVSYIFDIYYISPIYLYGINLKNYIMDFKNTLDINTFNEKKINFKHNFFTDINNKKINLSIININETEDLYIKLFIFIDKSIHNIELLMIYNDIIQRLKFNKDCI